MYGKAPGRQWTVLAICIGVSAAAVMVLVGLLIHGV